MGVRFPVLYGIFEGAEKPIRLREGTGIVGGDESRFTVILDSGNPSVGVGSSFFSGPVLDILPFVLVRKLISP